MSVPRVNLIALGIGLAAGGAAWAYVRYDPSPTPYAPAVLAVVALAGLAAAAAASPAFSLALLSFALVTSVALGGLVFTGPNYALFVVASVVLVIVTWTMLTRRGAGPTALLCGVLAGLGFFVLLWWVAVTSAPIR